MTDIDILVNNSESFRLYTNTTNELCFGVLCGGVGMYEAKIKLLPEEEIQYQKNGENYLKKLAYNIREFTSKYESRFIP